MMRHQCHFERQYWAQLDHAKLSGDETAAKWARLLLQVITETHKKGICACQNRGKDAR